MPDVHVDLIGRNRVGNAARGAANDLDKLARKMDKINKTTAKVNVKTNIKGAQDKDARNLGRRFGVAFSEAVGNAISDGTRFFGNAVKRALIKGGAGAQGIAALVGLRIDGYIGQALTAGLALFLGPALLAGPIAFLLRGQSKAAKESEKLGKKQEVLRKQLERAERGGARTKAQKQRIADLRKELGILEQQQDRLDKQSAGWQRLKGQAKSFMQAISAPLQVPLQASLDIIGKGLKQIQGPLRDIMAQLGTALPGFTKGAMDTFLNFITALKPALPGIVAGMKAWGAELPKIGTAFGNMIAKIMANPDAVVQSVTTISNAIQTLASAAGTIVSGLTTIGNGFSVLTNNIDAFENLNFGAMTGVFRTFVQTMQEEVIIWLSVLDSIFAAIPEGAFKWSPQLKAMRDGVHNALTQAQTDLQNWKAKWQQTDAEIAKNKIIAKVETNIASAEAKLATIKQKLKDPNLSKPKRIKLEAKADQLERTILLSKARLIALGKIKSKPKIDAVKKGLESKLKDAYGDLARLQKKKTTPKVNADIKAALARINQLEAALASIKAPPVRIPVYYSGPGPVPKGATKRVTSIGPSWQAALNGGGVGRTQSPTVNVAAPEVITNVNIDGRQLASTVRSQVIDENRRQTWRARVGRR